MTVIITTKDYRAGYAAGMMAAVKLVRTCSHREKKECHYRKIISNEIEDKVKSRESNQ